MSFRNEEENFLEVLLACCGRLLEAEAIDSRMKSAQKSLFQVNFFRGISFQIVGMNK